MKFCKNHATVYSPPQVYSALTLSYDSTQMEEIMWGRSGLISNRQGVCFVKNGSEITKMH